MAYALYRSLQIAIIMNAVLSLQFATIINALHSMQVCFAAAPVVEETSTSGRRDKKTGYAAGEWDIAKMAPKLKGQA